VRRRPCPIRVPHLPIRLSVQQRTLRADHDGAGLPGDWREAEDRPDLPSELPGTVSPSLVDLMRMTREEWDVWTRGSAIRRAGYAGFKRNVAVAMGNWLASLDEPPAEAVAALREALEESEPLVREHARWAFGRAE
jgi:epoxyqueuosine reductase QueG